MHIRRKILTAIAILAGSGICANAVADNTARVTDEDKMTALDRYVFTDDPSYEYNLVNTIDGEGFTAYVIDMTSQTWRKPEEVNRTLWKHWVVTVVPDKVSHTTGLLFIGGGGNGGEPPKRLNEMLVRIASMTESVVTELHMVPNQPLIFAGETEGRSEDSLIAYTWDKFLRGGDDQWLARLPMTKSAVRAMDTITSFCASDEGGAKKVDTFVVAGGSKRGWTTWTTGAVDKRVVAIVPIVIDMLNIVPSFKHHWSAYGFWAPSVGDYVSMGIMEWMGDPAYDRLLSIVEPYSYRDRFTLPKLVMNSAGDQFFLPDSWKFYYNDLPDPKVLRYVPNSNHGLDRTDAIETLASFYASILNDSPLPKYTWRVLEDGALEVKTEDTPKEVRLWQATNPEARDFRQETLGNMWTSSVLEPDSPGVYVGRVNAPVKGWTAFMVELTYPTPLPVPFKVTTGVNVTPDTLPFTYEPPKKSPAQQ